MSDTSVFSVKSWAQLRALLYVVAPLVIAATVTTHATEWIGLVTAVLAPALAAVNSVDGFRTWFYGVLAAGQAVLIGLNLVTDQQVAPWLSIIGAVLGGGVAAANVYSTR